MDESFINKDNFERNVNTNKDSFENKNVTPQFSGVFFLAYVQVCRDRVPLSRHNSSVACMSSLCKRPGLVMRTPSPIVCGRAFYRGQLYRHPKTLCRDRISFDPGQFYYDIELLCRDIISPCLGQLRRDIKILTRDRKSSQPGQLCRNIEFLYCNTKPLHLATLYCDIKTFYRDRKLLAWPTLLRPKNILS